MPRFLTVLALSLALALTTIAAACNASPPEPPPDPRIEALVDASLALADALNASNTELGKVQQRLHTAEANVIRLENRLNATANQSQSTASHVHQMPAAFANAIAPAAQPAAATSAATTTADASEAEPRDGPLTPENATAAEQDLVVNLATCLAQSAHDTDTPSTEQIQGETTRAWRAATRADNVAELTALVERFCRG